VTQSAPITATSLALHGTQPESNFQLLNAGNSVANLAATFDAA